MIPDDTKLGFGGGANGTSAPDFGIEFDNSNNRTDISGSVTRFTNQTQATDKDTASVVFEGGVGIEKNLVVGGTIIAPGTSTFDKIQINDNII